MFTIGPPDFPYILIWLKEQKLDGEWCVTHYDMAFERRVLIFIKDEYLAILFKLRASDLFIREPRTIKNAVVLRSLLIDCERQKDNL